MNVENLQLAHQIVDVYCKKNKFDRNYLHKKIKAKE